LGNGDGIFQAAHNYSLADRVPISIAIGDLNRDGKPDVVVTARCASSTNCRAVSTLLGNGDGSFQTAVTHDSGGMSPEGIALADVNGDSNLDILVTNCAPNGSASCYFGSQGSIAVLLGNGNGTFQTIKTFGSGGVYATSIAVADVNKDGKLDVVVLNCADSGSCEASNAGVGVLLIDGTAQAYARSSSVRIGVMMGSTFTATLSFEAIAAACQGLKRLAGRFCDLHPGLQLAIISAGIAATAHPKSRAKLASLWERTKQAALAFLSTIADIAIQIAEAMQTEAEASKRLQDSLPIRRRRSALMHARVVCLAARTPLSLSEIEKRIRADGYVSRARNLGIYLRRVLLTSGQFQQLDTGLWAMAS
jgi:FG-GAP-like repeat/FG-GAP repeat